jgi:hypothetical protein
MDLSTKNIEQIFYNQIKNLSLKTSLKNKSIINY